MFEEQGIDTSQMLGEMQLTLLAMAAQEESTSISKNMRWSYQKRMERGEYITTKAPYGYRIEHRSLSPHPEEAAVVKTIFQLFLEGKGQQQIAFLLNKKCIVPRESDKWGRTSIEHILSNEKYMGDALVQKRFNTETLPHKQVINRGQLPQYYIYDSHPPIVSKTVFERVQILKASRASPAKQKPHIFTHRIQCPSCGRFYRHINCSGTSENMRTLAFQVPKSLFQRVKAYLECNHMTQKQFVIGLIEDELEHDEAQYQAEHPEEQEDEEESDEQSQDEETEEETQDQLAALEAQDGPGAGLEEQPADQEDTAPRGRF